MLSVPYVGWLLFVIILVIGHVLNLFMATLGGFVHPLRLTFVEFYKNAGFNGGGIEYKPFNNADMNETGADITKAKTLLSWQPQIDFETGIDNTIKWHKQNISLLDSLD